MNKLQTNGNAKLPQFLLPIGPGYDREAALRAIDKAVSQIERILNDMEKEDARPESRAAFERFMVDLAPSLHGLAGRIKVQNNVSWIKIESLVNGHKVYISKGKLAVGRIDCTLPPDLVPGARHPMRSNGLIASWLPADLRSVRSALVLLGSDRVKPLKR